MSQLKQIFTIGYDFWARSRRDAGSPSSANKNRGHEGIGSPLMTPRCRVAAEEANGLTFVGLNRWPPGDNYAKGMY